MEMTHDFGNVVSFARKAETVNFPAVSQVDAYWEGLRDGRLMPDRSEVDPRGLENALEFAFMLECVAPGVARVRIAGMHLSDLLGMEVRGMPLTAFFEPSARERMGEVLNRVVTSAHVADLRLSSGKAIGRPPLTARLFLAPLSNQGHANPRILGCLQSDGRVGRTPRRFTIEAVHMRRIVAAAGHESVPAPAPAPQAETPPRASDFAEDGAVFVHASKAETPKRPALRLVKSENEDA